ncbi:MAG: RraA family protein [Janthinobacterium lividum]
MNQVPAHHPIRRDFERVSPDLVARARIYQAAILADVAGRRGTLHGRIQPLATTMRVAGPAFTVEVRPGDNLMIHAALAMARPGDVIVVDGKGDLSCALTGALMSAQAAAAGLGGFVIDAAVRDREECAAREFPIFAAGCNPNGPTRSLAGQIGWPISIAGTAVEPGDLIVGDADGVVVIPRSQAARIVAAAQAKVDLELARVAAIRQGNLVSAWLPMSLRALGLLGADEAL